MEDAIGDVLYLKFEANVVVDTNDDKLPLVLTGLLEVIMHLSRVVYAYAR